MKTTQINFTLLALLATHSMLLQAGIQFDDISISSGVAEHRSETWGASVGDYNGDGYPDIFSGNHLKPAVLLHNNGNGTFTDSSLFADASNAWNRQFTKRVDEHGAAWGDYDNDGDLDLVTANSFAPPFYENRDGRLYQIANKVPEMHWAAHSRWFDNDRDGDLDLVFNPPRSNVRMHYYRNNNNHLSFTSDFYGATGINCEMALGTLSDINLDGQMDVLCGQHNASSTNGGRYFTLTNGRAHTHNGLPSIRPVRDMAVADFDGDLRPDIFMLRGALRPSDGYQDGPNRVEAHMVTQGDTLKTIKLAGQGTLSIELDWNRNENRCNNGDLHVTVGAREEIIGRGNQFDKFIANLNPADSRTHGLPPRRGCRLNIGYYPAEKLWRVRMGGYQSQYVYMRASSDQALSYEGIDNQQLMEQPVYPHLLMNKLSGFQNQATNAGFDKVKCASVVAADFDNDMDVDVYLACRAGSHNLPNRLYENNGKGEFTLVSDAGGAAGSIGATLGANRLGAGNSDSVVSADFNLDGFVDLFVTNGLNLRPNVGVGPYNLFYNRGNGNHWLQFDLRGTISNRDGVGAKLFIDTPDGKTQIREQSGGYHRWSQNHMRVHVGLGKNTSARIRVVWPNGHTDNYDISNVNAIYQLAEGGGVQQLLNSKAEPVPCGKPQNTTGSLLWKNCFSGKWQLHTRGESRIATISSSNRVNVLRHIDLESGDSIRHVNTNTLEAHFNARGNDQDGMEFTLPDGEHCLRLDDPDAPLIVGTQGTVWRGSLDLKTMRACADTGTDKIHVAVDDSFTLYVNGDIIGHGNDWLEVYQYQLDLEPGDVIAVDGRDITGAAVLIANIQLDGVDYDSSNNWKVSTVEQVGWFMPGFDDSGWANASEHGDVNALHGRHLRGWPAGKNARWIWGHDIQSVNRAFIRFRLPFKDSDGDGVPDSRDAFPNDPTESVDSDGDGVGDNSDAFPFDPTETKDTDGDGIGDNSDPYPLDPNNRPPGSAACGEPTWSANSDRATFIWQDCTQTPAPWYIRTSGGATPSKLVFEGNIVDENGINNYQPFRLENNDVVNQANANTLDYGLIIYNSGVDGLRFTASNAGCFRAIAPNNLPVYIGADRRRLNNSSHSFAFANLEECPLYIDSDNDGLSNSEEAALGTDPDVADTDAGGVNDGDEVRNGTDPLDGSDDSGSIDSDNDGLSDSREAQLGTNPGNPDTDGERLLDGEEVDVYNTDPLRANTDRDGLSDWAEAKVFGTDPTNPDTDGDGLNDGPERKTYNTDPLKADTDGGGVDDGTEIQNGTNPLDPADG